MTTTPTTSVEASDTDSLVPTVDAYIASLNETDPPARRALIEQAWEESGHYVDPLLEAAGHAALHEMVDGIHTQFPGHRFHRTSGVDAHHSLVRFGWRLDGPDGTVTVAGTDIGIVGPNGRLQRIGGFFGELPERDD